MKTLIISLIFLISSVNTVYASDDGSGAYFGLAGGYSTYNAFFLHEEYYIDDNTTVSTTKSFRDNSTGLKVYGGYQFNKIVAVEAAYIEYGKFTTTDYTQDPSSFSVYANLGYNFLNGQLRPFGMIGLGSLNNFQSRDLLQQTYTTIHGGVGIEYSPTSLYGLGFRASVEWDAHADYQNAVDETNNQEVSAMFYQYYSLWSLAVQYKF